MKKIKIFTLLVLFLVVAIFSSLNNFISADVNESTKINEDGSISPMYIVYCPINASGDGRHYDNSSMPTKVMINGNIYNAREWTCPCGAQVITTDDYGNYYFYPSESNLEWYGIPYLPGSFQYWEEPTLYYGEPIEWMLPN